MPYNPLKNLDLEGAEDQVDISAQEEPEVKKGYDVNKNLFTAIEEDLFPKRVSQEEEARVNNELRKPKTWTGELAGGIARGTDSLQETFYGAGALAADYLGAEGAKNYFIGKAKQQEDEMALNPASVPSYEGVDGFDKGARYFLGQLGQGVPQVAESVLTAVAGSAIGSAVGPEGTVAGGIAGFVGRRAVRNIIKSNVDDVIKAEVKDYAEGKIKREALSEVAESLLKKESLTIARKAGTYTAIGANVIAQESGSIYTDLLKNPNVTESDRRTASLVGGIVAAIPDLITQGWIASKFFPKAGAVPREQLKDASNYLVQFAKTYGKEILKVIPAEGGQEFIQTVVEQAAKDWAEFGPEVAMSKVMNPTHEQVVERIDATFGGMAMGFLSGGVSALAESSNPKVRQKMATVAQKADDASFKIEPETPTAEDIRLSEIQTEKDKLSQVVPKDKAEEDSITTRLKELTKEELDITTSMDLVDGQKIVNDNELKIQYTKNGAVGEDIDGKSLIAEGSESIVYRDGDEVIKVSEPFNDKSEDTYNKRVKSAIDIDSQLGSGTLRHVGHYIQNGVKNPVFRQKFIEGRDATEQEIDSHMTSRGFTKTGQSEYTKGKTVAKDLDGDNVKVSNDGTIEVIDASLFVNDSKEQSTKPSLSPIEAALAAFGEGALRATADRISAGKETTLTKPESIEQVKSSPVHTFRENADGSLTVTGVIHPVTKQWVGVSPISTSTQNQPSHAPSVPTIQPSKAPIVEDEEQTQIRALYAKIMPTGKALTRASKGKREAYRRDIAALVNGDGTATGAKKAYNDKVINILSQDRWIDLLAAEDIIVANDETSTHEDIKGSKSGEFQVTFNTEGKIEIVIPRYDNWAHAQGLHGSVKEAFIQQVGKTLEHEIIHVAQLVGIRNEYDANSDIQEEHGSLVGYANHVDRQLSTSMQKWWKALPVAKHKKFESLRNLISNSYAPSRDSETKKGMKKAKVDSEIQGEGLRMLVELARTGDISETTEALFHEQREKGSPEYKGLLSDFLQNWIGAIRRIKAALEKLLDFNTAPTDVVEAFHDINRILNKYGVLVNDKLQPRKEKKTKEGKNDLAPTGMKPKDMEPAGLIPGGLEPEDLSPGGLEPDSTIGKQPEKKVVENSIEPKTKTEEELLAQARENIKIAQEADDSDSETAWIRIARWHEKRIAAKKTDTSADEESMRPVTEQPNTQPDPDSLKPQKSEPNLQPDSETTGDSLVNEKSVPKRSYTAQQFKAIVDSFIDNATPEQKAIALISGALRPVANLNQETFAEGIDGTVSILSTTPNVEDLIDISRRLRADKNLTAKELDRLMSDEWTGKQRVAAGWMATYIDNEDYLKGYDYRMNIPLLQQKLGVKLDVPSLVNEKSVPKKSNSKDYISKEISEAGETQRGYPESQMLQAQRAMQSAASYATPIVFLIEHIGDLSNRAARTNAMINVRDKVKNYFDYGGPQRMSLEEDIEQSYVSNAIYNEIKETIPDYYEMKVEERRRIWNEVMASPNVAARIVEGKKVAKDEMAKFAESHKKETKAITKGMRLSRFAAIEFGQQKWKELRNTMILLRDWNERYFDAKSEEEKWNIFTEGYEPLVNEKSTPKRSSTKLAPNGKKSNLTDKQWQQVRTPQFKAWFGDWENDPKNASNVVDENGEPLVVYHGTIVDGIEIFNTEAKGWITGLPKGSHFGTEKQANHMAAHRVAKEWYNNQKDASRVIYPVYLNIRKPNLAFDTGHDWSKQIESSKKEGYDGIKYENQGEGDGLSYVAFDSTQIKSATDNNGDFSKEKASIKKSNIKPPPEQMRKLNSMAFEAQSLTSAVVNNLGDSKVETKERGNQLVYEGFSTAILEYANAPHTESAKKANAIVNEKGTFNVIGSLLKNRWGADLGIVEDTGETLDGPNPVLKAVYETVLVHLSHINQTMDNEESFGIREQNFIESTFRTLESRMAEMGTKAGQWNAFTGKMLKFWDGAKARASLVEPLLNKLANVFGKNKGREHINGLTKELNDLMARHVNGTVSTPEMIATLRKLKAAYETKEFKDAVRQTIAKNNKKANQVAKAAAKKAALNQALDEDGEALIEAVINSLINKMANVGRDTGTKTDLEIFRMAISKMSLDAMKDLGLIEEKETKKPVSMERKLSALLKNDSLYDEFIDNLHSSVIEELGGLDPSDDFIKSADDMKAEMKKRWRPEMVEKLVNDKMKQHQFKFSEMVKEKMGKPTYKIGQIKESVKTYMQSQGVTNEDHINALVNDLETAMEKQLDNARAKFFGSAGSVNDALRHFQDTLRKAAMEHASYGENYQQNFSEYLQEEYGLPNTKEFPIADKIAQIQQAKLNSMLNGYTNKDGKHVEGERERIIRNWIEKSAVKPKVKRQLEQSIDKIIKLTNLGVMNDENIYKALQQKFNLPNWDEELAEEARRLGDQIGRMSDPRTKDIMKQKLSMLIEGKRGITTKDLYIAGLYVSMLSGPSTQVVNVASNASSLIGYVMVEAVKHPTRIGKMVRALARAAVGSAQVEMRETFWTGMTLGKDGSKFFNGQNVLEHTAPTFTSGIKNDKLRRADEAIANFGFKLIRGLKGNYVFRALSAMDIYFYKIAQEIAFTARVGDKALGSPEMWASATVEARRQVESQGMTPDTNRDHRRFMEVLKHKYFEEARIVNDSDATIAWQESHSEAQDVTFQQEPKGWLGLLSRLIEKWTEGKPIAKLLVPFTKVAANVTNAMLEWTPYGYARWMFSKDFKIETIVDGEKTLKWDHDIAIRASLGMIMIFALLTRLGEEDDENPDFTIYADGPRDLNKKRQMQERGWKPYTIKVGDQYISYLYTPVGMTTAIVGKLMDDYRDGKIDKPSISNISMTSTSVAMLRLVTQQSFLAGISDIMGAVDSPDPAAKLSRLFGRMGSTFIVPNFAKQLDKWVSPTVQEADGFWESFLREIPVVRENYLKPMLNVFGEEVKRNTGMMPGSERFVTSADQEDESHNIKDDVLRMLGEKRITVPGYSKSSMLGDRHMTVEEFYEYVKKSGPKVKADIRAEISSLKQMTREQAQERIEKIATDVKKRVKSEMKSNLNR